ncbi:diguanylate cyclase (GGDEF)-like protein/PAS domain S-box-containing protein [Salibacterium salarium]|uniref:putative bifunctional diguanylate cyclase/phosphodiesterase n=1 Tax=Salibacterium salarium TaxID=284579 RepID=UPI0027899E61|nr:EAL domain-containing protein [Salibacterium salarium]MDQ0298751.1 diguanylate cyclase (GGDEF)-like protein/PAS domain S-box-containing protein [Salibacterium salarium]
MRRNRRLERIVQNNAFIITGSYFVVGFLWIIFSDQIVSAWNTDVGTTSMMQTYKGWFYVIGTSLLLYITVSKLIKKERKREWEKRQADLMYKAVFDNVNDLLFLAPLPKLGGGSLTFNEGNKSARAMLGYDDSTWEHFTLADITSEPLREKAITQERLISQKNYYTFDWEFVNKDGRTIPVEIQTTKASILGTEMVLVVARDISAYKQAVEDIHQLSYYDRITHLPNYNSFLRRLQQVEPKQNRLVLALNINRFRRINETLGAEIGDKVLAIIARRLQEATGSDENLARKTNDEFLLMSRSSGPKEVEELIEKLERVFNPPIRIGQEELILSFTVGVACDEDGKKEAKDLVQQTDIAFSRAKRKGWQYSIYRTGMEKEARSTYILENDLYHSLSRQEMFLMYQPFVYGGEGKTIGMEALLRWNHSKKGLIPPSTFIPMAENNGFIHTLGRWVLQQVCKEIGPVLYRNPTWTVAVNISTQQLEGEYFIDELWEVVQSNGVSPQQLELEITERTTMQPDLMLPILHKLKELGFRISLDDFGTGYSSLSQLKELPVDTLKIDRSFIDDINDRKTNIAIVKTIIDAAENLNMKVIAEGIEKEEQAKELLTLQCCYFQGYYYSIPKKINEFSWGKESS